MTTFTVVLTGGSPWGFRLQGGQEFNEPVRIARGVFPHSKNNKRVSFFPASPSDTVDLSAVTVYEYGRIEVTGTLFSPPDFRFTYRIVHSLSRQQSPCQFLDDVASFHSHHTGLEPGRCVDDPGLR
ncbi:hypothetical protein RRG08_061030 [Elysia crispata]|uniref:Uncharacterized protein n=1 Tax=Elysia crispata TaxID=231223 RepID=A0AAE1AVY7_9GAST|nr:hypothetical protein RRG08_061030 [Elysia crispata]